jgi:sulfate adenylyltransferase subunit 2
LDHLYELENRSVYILREAYANIKSLGMLWSMGKDSTVLLWLTRKAFFGHIPFPLIHIDTHFKIPEMIRYRDQMVRDLHLNMIVGSNLEALEAKRTFPDGALDRLSCCATLKTQALKQTLLAPARAFRFNHEKASTNVRSAPLHSWCGRACAPMMRFTLKVRYFSPGTSKTSGTSPIRRQNFGNQFKTEFAPWHFVRCSAAGLTELDIWD